MLPDEYVDPVVSDSALRQLGRLTNRVTDDRIGLNSVCLHLDHQGERIIGTSIDPGRAAKRNPQLNADLIERIRVIEKDEKVPLSAQIGRASGGEGGCPYV